MLEYTYSTELDISEIYVINVPVLLYDRYKYISSLSY